MEKLGSGTGFIDGYGGIAIELPDGTTLERPAPTVADVARLLRIERRGGPLALLQELGRVLDAEAELGRLFVPEAMDVLSRLMGRGEDADGAEAPAEDDGGPQTDLDDLLADYARAYGGPPPPWLPWPVFRALASRVGRADAAGLLQVMDGTAWGAASVMANEKAARKLQRSRRRVARLAGERRGRRRRRSIRPGDLVGGRTREEEA